MNLWKGILSFAFGLIIFGKLSLIWFLVFIELISLSAFILFFKGNVRILLFSFIFSIAPIFARNSEKISEGKWEKSNNISLIYFDI